MPEKKNRPKVPLEHADERQHRRMIAQRANAGLPLDGSEGMEQPLRLKSFAVADLPDAALWGGATVYVPDESGGAVTAFSDGTDWLRSTDRAIVS